VVPQSRKRERDVGLAGFAMIGADSPKEGKLGLSFYTVSPKISSLKNRGEPVNNYDSSPMRVVSGRDYQVTYGVQQIEKTRKEKIRDMVD